MSARRANRNEMGSMLRSPRHRKISLWDLAALLGLFLHATELTRLLGFATGIAPRTVSGASTLFFLVYLMGRKPDLVHLTRVRNFKAWIVAIFVLPIVMLLLLRLSADTTNGQAFYWTIFYLLFLELFLSAAVLWRRIGEELTAPFFSACIVVTLLGFLINLFDVDFIHQLALYVNSAPSANLGRSRLIGLQVQPNRAAFDLCIFLAVLVCDRRFLAAKSASHVLVLASCTVGVLVTGSRTSLILLVCIFFGYLRNRYRSDVLGKSAKRAGLIAVPVMLVSLGVSAAYFLVATRAAQGLLTTTIGTRLSSFDVLLGGDANADLSTSSRLSSSRLYIMAIQHSPLLGRGPDFAGTQVSNGVFENFGQNAFLEWALDFGVPYALFVAITVIGTWSLAARVRRANPSLIPANRLLVVIIVVSAFSIPGLLSTGALLVAVGHLLCALNVATHTQDVND